MLDIEPDLFSEFGNALNYHFVKRPWRNSRESFNHPKDISPNRTSGELVSVIINKWLEESELSTEIIRLDSSSIPIHCIINTDQIRALYNLVVGVNIMSMSFAKHLIQDMVLIPTIKFMRSLSGHIIPSSGILHILPIQVEGTPVHLSFYIFDTRDFDLLIGQPFRRLLYKGQSGKLKICLGKKLQSPLSISYSVNSRTEPYPQEDPLEEFRAAFLLFLAKPRLEDEDRFFIEEEADPSEEEPLDEFAVPPKPPIGLAYTHYHPVLDTLF